MTIFTVDTTADIVNTGDGVLSLREALALADATKAADSILFADAVQGQVVVLTGSQLIVDSDVTIDGGVGVTIDADEKSRVMLVEDGTADDRNGVTLTHLTVTGGRTTGDDFTYGGGGIRSSGYTTLTLDRTMVSGNRTTGHGAGGGGISASDVTLIDSTVSGNCTSGEAASGGGILAGEVTLTGSAVSANNTVGRLADGGGIWAFDVTLTNSTVSGNSAMGNDAAGGGIYGFTVALIDTTVSGNNTAGASAVGGGISADDGILRNSVVAGNMATGSMAPDVAGRISSNGLNIFGSDVDSNTPSDRENVPASLLFAGGLVDNGGLTQTIALRDAADNPALGGANPATAPVTDQRGAARPTPEGSNPDIGAFELDQSDPGPPPVGTTFVVTTASDVSADDGVLSLREALALADSDNLTADRIEFAAAVQGQTIVLGGSQLARIIHE